MLHFWTPDIGGSPWMSTPRPCTPSTSTRLRAAGRLVAAPSRKKPHLPPAPTASTPGPMKTAGYGGSTCTQSATAGTQGAFFRAGAESLADDRSDFTLRDRCSAGNRYRAAPWMTFWLAAASCGPTSPGRTTHPGHPGAVRRHLGSRPGAAAHYLIGAVGFLVDTCDQPGNPHRGMMLVAACTRYDDPDGRVPVQSLCRRYPRCVPLVPAGTWWVRAWPPWIAGIRKAGAVHVESALGGSHILRGFRAFRFRARTSSPSPANTASRSSRRWSWRSSTTREECSETSTTWS